MSGKEKEGTFFGLHGKKRGISTGREALLPRSPGEEQTAPWPRRSLGRRGAPTWAFGGGGEKREGAFLVGRGKIDMTSLN